MYVLRAPASLIFLSPRNNFSKSELANNTPEPAAVKELLPFCTENRRRRAKVGSFPYSYRTETNGRSTLVMMDKLASVLVLKYYSLLRRFNHRKFL